jgi:glycosyltransferase involved in cell wall biosynthesis
VASLAAQTHRLAGIVIVVDHNRGLFDRVRSEIPGVTVVVNRGEPGLSGARNAGIAAAHSELVAFLDDDAAAEPECLAEVVGHFDDAGVIGVGSSVVPAWADRRPDWFPHEFDWVVGCTYEGLPTRVAPVRNPIGGFMVIRRGVFEEVGGFRSDLGRVGTLPVGCEETELCLRASRRRSNARFLLVPAARVHHHVPRSRGTGRYFRSRCFREGQSKAMVRKVAGATGLAPEGRYVTRTLPRAVARGMADAARGDPNGLRRAGAVVLGVTWATAGFAHGTVTILRQSRAGGPVESNAPPVGRV